VTQTKQVNNGLLYFLKFSVAYDLLQWMAGTHKVRKWLAANYWRLNKSKSVVDLGCGTGSALKFLPDDIRYMGIDSSQRYIDSAREKHGNRGTFHVSTVSAAKKNALVENESIDLVICNGLLHHLSDLEVEELLTLSKSILAKTGRLVCCEPAFLAHQSSVSRKLMSFDRGKGIRTELEWKEMFEKHFESVQTEIFFGVSAFPYTRIVVVAKKN
jgi:ubiquinone/menaquinone biosynthesis C-methylase UbiE